MADFRKLLYAFAGVMLLAGLIVPASAQTLMTCTGTANNPLIRAEDFTADTGDIFVTCTGGIVTGAGLPVPKIDITVFTTSTTITSKITDTSFSPNFNEALLIVDEAGSVGSTNPMLNCGNVSAPYGSTPFTCDMLGTGSGVGTYNGTASRPNVFQARQVNTSAGTAIQFLGIPLDPGPFNGISAATRTLRITNVRVNAVALGVVTGAFTQSFINTTVNFNGTNFGGTQVINVVNGTVRPGLVAGKSTVSNPANFLQCTATSGNAKNSITITEGFSTAFKVRNWRQIQINGNPPGTGGSDWNYNGTTNWSATDVNQNVPNALYNTESGLMYPPGVANPVPGNPPPGTGPSGVWPGGVPFSDASGTPGNIDQAGTVTQGTRVAVQFSASPAGSAPSLPNTVLLKSSGITTGVMVLVTGTDAAGAGGTPLTTGSSTLLSGLTNNLAVYEVLFSNPSAIETATITVIVNPVISLISTPSTPEVSPAGLTATVGFAPFYSPSSGAATAALMSSTFVAATAPSTVNFFPIPRFITALQGPFAVYDYSKCACNLLFPWVIGDGTFTTSIVIANTSLDPNAGGTTFINGFTAAPQAGKVQFWYFGTVGVNLDPNGTATAQASQTSTVSVPAGSYLVTFVTPNSGGTTAANGLTKLSANFAGYIIAQAGFQYCHGYASINGAGFPPQTYLGLTLDKGSALSRTSQSLQDGLVH